MPRCAALLAVLLPLALSGCTRDAQTPGQEPAQSSPPPLFAALAFDEAVALTKGSERVLVVDSTASWCGPCKQMDVTTWRDAGVVAWFEANGLVIQFDVDEQKELAKQLAIEALPTLIAYRDGQEFDRAIGYQSAPQLLAWLAGVKRGEQALLAVASRAKRAPSGSKEEVDARYELARELVQRRDYDRATVEFEWLWLNSRDTPGYGGVRGSFMAGSMGRLAEKHAPAKERFAKLRDELAAKLEQPKVERDDLDDWIVLNEVVGETSKTLDWFDRVKRQELYLPLVMSAGFRLERLLEAEGRWADIALLHPSPAAELDQAVEMLKSSLSMSERMGEREQQFIDMQWQRFRDNAGKLYAVLLFDSRPDEAAALSARALEFDDSAPLRMALVERALDAQQTCADLQRLLAEAESKDANSGPQARDLRERLEQALATSVPPTGGAR